MEYVIVHNPRCSKSRQTLELLQSKGVEPKILEYLKEGVNERFLHETMKALGKRPKEVVRTKEQEFKELNLDMEDDNAVIKAMVAHPKIIERPIVIKGESAVIGRPPENVLELI
ncbi:MAG: arsenate reductase (glutaredoxin) [Halobacteriovoraceae bacterium]|nr:arsenate reductase (glutaredoxin) [Halobacteriovoraceae bacterium]|tara:strand:- start:27340 stop:27681 length:342 start_codon:yes stop_codon:yes gene_type:complete